MNRGTADEGARRAAAALPQHQFGRQQLYPGKQAGCRDALEQPVAGPFAEHAHGLVDGGQRRLAQVAGEDVVEPDHGDLFRYPDAGRGERSQHPDGHLVVGGDHGVRELAPAFGEDPPAGHQPAIDIVRAVGGAGQPGGRVVTQHLQQPAAPLGRVRHAGRAVASTSRDGKLPMLIRIPSTLPGIAAIWPRSRPASPFSPP